MVPGRLPLSLAAVWALPYDPLGDFAPDTPFVHNLRAFLTGDDAERSTIFKLIPRRSPLSPRPGRGQVACGSRTPSLPPLSIGCRWRHRR